MVSSSSEGIHVQIRPGSPDPDEPEDDGDEAIVRPPLAAHTWRIDRVMIALKIIGIVAFAAIPQVFETNTASRWFGIVIAVALAIYLARDLIAPVRLAADADGVTVIQGFAGHRQIPWGAIDGIRVDKRRRAGFLEIETPESLHLFSRYDLGMAPDEAEEMLVRIRP
jgi:hypothetical protein